MDAPPVPSTPTSVPTRTTTPRPTATIRRTPTATATAKPTAGPSPTPSAAQACAGLLARGTAGIFVIYLHPEPDLVWDTVPRQFVVGLCNTIPPPSVPQGKYKIILNFANHGLMDTHVTTGELKPGMNELSIGPYIHGYENHMAICAQRPVAEVQVMYNDTSEPPFHALLWPDGSDRVAIPIKCGGNFA